MPDGFSNVFLGMSHNELTKARPAVRRVSGGVRCEGAEADICIEQGLPGDSYDHVMYLFADDELHAMVVSKLMTAGIFSDQRLKSEIAYIFSKFGKNAMRQAARWSTNRGTEIKMVLSWKAPQAAARLQIERTLDAPHSTRMAPASREGLTIYIEQPPILAGPADPLADEITAPAEVDTIYEERLPFLETLVASAPDKDIVGEPEAGELTNERYLRAYHKAERLADRGDYDGAIAVYKELVERWPVKDHPQDDAASDPFDQIAHWYLMKGNSALAREWWRKGLEKLGPGPTNSRLTWVTARILETYKRPDDCRAILPIIDGFVRDCPRPEGQYGLDELLLSAYYEGCGKRERGIALLESYLDRLTRRPPTLPEDERKKRLKTGMMHLLDTYSRGRDAKGLERTLLVFEKEFPSDRGNAQYFRSLLTRMSDKHK